jgi:Ca2+-binding EF-hand superfamily protein
MTVGDVPVSPHQGQVIEEAGARFGLFDIDRDGYISASESQADPALESQWKDLDRNADDRLDRSELARFEPQPP